MESLSRDGELPIERFSFKQLAPNLQTSVPNKNHDSIPNFLNDEKSVEKLVSLLND
jgi:hypothetical protein